MDLANTEQKGAGIAVLIAVKIKFKAKSVTKNKEGHCTKGSIPQQDNNCTLLCTIIMSKVIE